MPVRVVPTSSHRRRMAEQSHTTCTLYRRKDRAGRGNDFEVEPNVVVLDDVDTTS